jgi:hypothetical protein
LKGDPTKLELSDVRLKSVELDDEVQFVDVGSAC